MIHRSGLQGEAFLGEQMMVEATQQTTNDNLIRSTVGTVQHLVREYWPGFITMATGIPSRLKRGRCS